MNTNTKLSRHMNLESSHQILTHSRAAQVAMEGDDLDAAFVAKQQQQWQAPELYNQHKAFLSTIAVLFVTLIIVFFVTRVAFKRKKSKTILLAGLPGACKTTLFYKKQKIKPITVVDVPGHARLQPKLEDLLPQARGIVFVVDALDFMPQLRAGAEYLYDILMKAEVVQNKVPVLLACNTTDNMTAHSTEFIRKQLEKEINKLRMSRSSISAADVTSEVSLGLAGEPFKFTQCVNQVATAEVSALTGKVEEVEQFIRDIVKQ